MLTSMKLVVLRRCPVSGSEVKSCTSSHDRLGGCSGPQARPSAEETRHNEKSVQLSGSYADPVWVRQSGTRACATARSPRGAAVCLVSAGHEGDSVPEFKHHFRYTDQRSRRSKEAQ